MALGGRYRAEMAPRFRNLVGSQARLTDRRLAPGSYGSLAKFVSTELEAFQKSRHPPKQPAGAGAPSQEPETVPASWPGLEVGDVPPWLWCLRPISLGCAKPAREYKAMQEWTAAGEPIPAD
jgi:hypothetical protein